MGMGVVAVFVLVLMAVFGVVAVGSRSLVWRDVAGIGFGALVLAVLLSAASMVVRFRRSRVTRRTRCSCAWVL